MPEEKDAFQGRVNFVGISALVVAAVLIVRLFQIQVVEHREKVAQLEDKLTQVKVFMSGRGRILSRDGQVLATDAPSYQLQIRLSELSFSQDLGILELIHYHVHSNYVRYRPIKQEGMVKPDRKELLAKVKGLRERLSKEAILLDLSHNLQIDLDDLVRGVQRAMENCVKRWALLHQDQLLGIFLSPEASRQLLSSPERYAGFSCTESSIRHYPQGEIASHITGYMGRLSEKNYQILRVHGIYPPGERRIHPVILSPLERQELSWVRNFHVGVSGVEWIFNDHLRGRLHQFTFRRDLSDLPFHEPEVVEGRNLQLTIDLELQKLGTELMKGRQGAIVMFDLDSGDVLVSVSLPAFDPNLITPPTEVNFGEYISARPGLLMHRGVGNHYPFGSVYKIITSVAVLEEGIATPESTYYCGRVHERTGLKCLGYHSHINVEKALERSCNVYFYEAALDIGPFQLYNWARKFGLGERLDCGLPFEKKGVNPNPAYKLEVGGEMWYPGDTCHMAIGQGYQLGTPLQAAMVSALVSRPEGAARPRFWGRPRTPPMKLDLKPSTFKAVRQGMWNVVNHEHGTAHDSVSDKIIFAGKTGTADVYRKEPHAWFSGFAPYDEPKVAISVIVENGGHGGDESAPIAKALFEAWQESYGD